MAMSSNSETQIMQRSIFSRLVVRRCLALTGAALMTVSLTACASGGSSRAMSAVTPTELYKLRAHDQSDEILLAVHGDGLSPAQDEAVRALASRWRDGGAHSIQITAPQNAGDPQMAYKSSQAVRARLIDAGVPAAAIQQVAYDAAGDVHAAMRVSFVRFEAEVPACGHSWDDLTSTGANLVQSNFGCATTANMASMIADPADIAGPHPAGVGDAARRVVVIQNYRKGQITSAATDGKSSGQISNAIGSGGGQ